MTRLNNKGGGTTTKSRRGNDDKNKNGKNSNNMIFKMKIAFILLLIIQVITIITLKSSSTSTSTAVVCGQGLQSYSSSDLESLSFNSPPITRSSSSSSSSNSDYDDYELARTQSFGFFDDIPSKQWKILQNIHYESFPNYYTKSTTTIDSTKVNPHYNDPIILQQYSNTMNDKRNTKNQLKYSNWWNGENFQIEFHCPMMRRVPSTSQADGPKWVCDLHRLISNNVSSNVDKSSNDSKSSKSKSECLIYSFGSNGKSEI